LSNLAGIFELENEDEKFADDARTLFFDFTPEQQRVLFTNLRDPTQVAKELQTVIQGVYTHLDPVGNEQHTAVLQAMFDSLAQIQDQDHPSNSTLLFNEIDFWLIGCDEVKSGNYEAAINAFNDAISFNDQNPALYLNLASAQFNLNRYEDTLKSLDRVLELDPGRKSQVIEIIRSDSSLNSYLQDNLQNQEFSTLAKFVE
jgi:tetratricopeptide (TPR) repeat protein